MEAFKGNSVSVRSLVVVDKSANLIFYEQLHHLIFIHLFTPVQPAALLNQATAASSSLDLENPVRRCFPRLATYANAEIIARAYATRNNPKDAHAID
jgi:hypothetical protein